MISLKLRLLKQNWGLLSLFVASSIYVFSLASHHPPNFSPYDEWVLYDYLVKVPTSWFVHIGERIGNEALFRMSCFGDAFGPSGEICHGPDWKYTEYAAYPLQAINSAAGYTPLYFWITYPLAKITEFIFHFDFITSARITGIFWLSIGFLFLNRIFSLFKINQLVFLGLGLGFLTLPLANSAFTYISADSTVFAFGTALIYFSLKYLMSKSSGWIILPIAFIGYLFKGTIFFAELTAAFLFVSFLLFGKRFLPSQQQLPIAKTLLISTFLIFSGFVIDRLWGIFISSFAIGASPEQGMATPLALRSVITGVLAFVPDFPDRNSMLVTDYVYIPISLLLVSGIIGWFFSQKKIDTNSLISAATLFTALLLVPAVVVSYSFIHGYVVPIPPRYGIGIYSLGLLSVAMISKNRISNWLIAFVGFSTFSVMVVNVYIPLN